MSQRQAVEFLRRRYAAAILSDDANTAGRLRARLDGVMNHAQRACWPGEARQPEAQAAPAPQAGPAAAERAADRSAPTLRLVAPVTGLLEGHRRGR